MELNYSELRLFMRGERNHSLSFIFNQLPKKVRPKKIYRQFSSQ